MVAMNTVDRAISGINTFQQRFLAYPFAVLVKFGDDQAGNLAALMAYYAFISIFPLFLVFATVLGYVLRDYPSLDHRLLHSAVIDFPLIGAQIKQSGLAGHWYTLVISFAISVWGAQGLARAIQTAFNTLWGVPFTDRPNFGVMLLRSAGLTTIMGLAILTTGLLSGVGSLSSSLGITLRVLSFLASIAINVGAFLLAFRLATARTVRFGDFARSAVAAALIWQALLAAGSLLIAHEVAHQQELYGAVGVVLGLLAWLNLQSALTLFAVEADVVRSKRLWPRSVTPPPLTRADRRAYRGYAKTTMRLPEAEVTVDVQFAAAPPQESPPPVT